MFHYFLCRHLKIIFSGMMEVGDSEICTDYTLPCPTNSQQLMIINDNESQEIENNSIALMNSEIDYPKTDNLDEPVDLDESNTLLGSPFSDSPESPLALPMTVSDESDDDFRGTQKFTLQRSKKQSFVFGDSSDDEPEDQLLPSDIAMIDDDDIENTSDFSHLNVLRIFAEKDDKIFEEKVVKKIPTLSLTSYENRRSPLPCIPELSFDSPIDHGMIPDPDISQKEKRRTARKRMRTWKINKKRDNVRKRAKILFL